MDPKQIAEAFTDATDEALFHLITLALFELHERGRVAGATVHEFAVRTEQAQRAATENLTPISETV